MDGWIEELWLVAIVEEVPDDEVRRWWNSKETELLDRLAATAPGFRLGTILTTVDEPQLGSPSRRVFDLMFLRGTCPQNFHPDSSAPYVLPLLGADLRSALLAAFSPQADDHPLMTAAPLSGLTEFLDKHWGARLTTHSPTEAVRVSLPATLGRQGTG
ncbi:hypothetical protein NIE79_004016 [Micromonospora sp. NIE79]|uniref:Uncharacterized protein n=1 Tax=Micromonospora trifolii TaxID=2911208 RepID=A0ABS9N6I9_9ACTN|nr:hypothetical protein [Micromonospora trifolii]MCG5445560.1 hypothetical protein [Micromonospora trifolii]